jgi:long-chain fatty acid transport protein
MKKNLKVVLFLLCFGSAAMFFSTTSALATDGMNLEGYGPIATGMGGASMAYDNGTAGVMNNPATLGLMPEGNRLDVALGYLGPHVSATRTGSEASSQANAFYMPALGWVKKSGSMAYGIAMFSQGGMGTEYDKNSWLAWGSGEKVRSELGVGRVLFPVAYEVNKDFIIGGSLDFVWASLDLKMALSGAQFLDMAGSFGGSEKFGSVSGSMMTTFGNFVGGGIINPGNPVNWGRFDFSDDSAFTGKAKGSGFAGKIGGEYKVSDKLAVGAAYHSKTRMSDLEASGANVTFNANVDQGYVGTGIPNGVYAPMTIPVVGRIHVKEFQWPQMLGGGVAYQASNKLMVVFDYKWINWKDVMKDFKMTFTADANQTGLAQGFANTTLDATLFQNWKDQHVFMLGAGYKVTDDFTLRGGLNIANNPIPNTYLSPLFPAIERNHVTLGTGYMLSKVSSVDLSYTYAPKVETINGQGEKVSHYQTNAQAMYSYRF